MIRLSVIGHLGHDALKKVINGKSVLSFSVAQNEQYRNVEGVAQERTTWINCSVWGRDNLAPYLRKGTLVYVEGRPGFKGYAGKQGEVLAGVNMRVTELALLPGARGVLGTGSVGLVEESEVERNEERMDEVVVEGEELDDKVDDGAAGNGGGRRRKGKSAGSRSEGVRSDASKSEGSRSGGIRSDEGVGREDDGDDEMEEDDGVRSDLPF